MSGKYEDEQEEIAEKLSKLRAEECESLGKEDTLECFMKLLKSSSDFRKLTPDILHNFIEKIVVHHAERTAGGKVQRLDIYYKYVGDVEVTNSIELPEISLETRAGVVIKNASFQKNKKVS